MIVKFGWRTDLLDQTCPQHHNAVCQRHGLHLIMSDINHGGTEIAVQLGDLNAHLAAQFRIEVRERFIEQEDLRMRTMERPIATRWR